MIDRISRSEKAQRECGCEKTGKKLSIQRRKENEGNESSDSFAGVRAQLSRVKERRSPLRLNVSGREIQRRMVPGVQEHENRVQL